uniref:NADH-ubiquinone oxidoreductase chain 1 n=1 Tax=Pinctada albina TaxID=315487 RepID=A0A1S5UZM0_9BIVA|nr:NADH dehydrogenase subunit 1 [Pinctada albina]
MLGAMSIINTVMVLVGVMLSVAYFTLLERKVLASFHLRKGPSKVGLYGVCQPLADAIKLFTKEFFCPHLSLKWAFFWSPSVAISIMCLTWTVLYPVKLSCTLVSLDVLVFLAISSLNVYVVMVAGWASNSKYASLAANRGFAQAISYEVVLTLISFCFIVLAKSFNFVRISWGGEFVYYLGVIPIAGLCWSLVILAETNRSPFDFVEAESELVSGYTVEYGGTGFALLFIAEYGNILFMSYFTASLLFPGPHMSWAIWSASMSLKTLMVGYWFIWVRGSLPRYRYDLLMLACWKSILPTGLVCFLGCYMFVSLAC